LEYTVWHSFIASADGSVIESSLFNPLQTMSASDKTYRNKHKIAQLLRPVSWRNWTIDRHGYRTLCCLPKFGHNVTLHQEMEREAGGSVVKIL